MDKEEAIVIRRRRRSKKAKHHGGSWKVAFADFTLAMMALFMVLWLVEASSPSQRRAIARYFAEPGVFDQNASNQPIEMDGPLIPELRDAPLPEPEAKPYGIGPTGAYYVDPEFGEVMAALQSVPHRDTNPKNIDNLRLEQLPIGIRIELTESKGQGMFGGAGSAQLEPYYEDVLLSLAPFLNRTGRAVMIRGHADASQFNSNRGRDNWDLSFDRAQAARKTLIFGGLAENRILNVSGLGDHTLLDKENPYSPSNRRIEILLLNEQSEKLLRSMLEPTGEEIKDINPSNVNLAQDLAAANQR